MKKRVQVYILITITLLVWGYVVFNVVKEKENNRLKGVLEEGLVTQTIIPDTGDQMMLFLNYPDPFLENFNGDNKNKKTSLKAQKRQEKKVWPSIICIGIIGNLGGDKIAILKVEKEEVLLEIGASYKGVKLVEVKNNFLIMKLGGEVKKITID
jgi:hypothetical protein